MADLSHLIERRVPHFFLVYLGVGWGIVQFLDFLERYGISPHWTDISLLALALLTPSVLLFTYNHGRPGKDAVTRSELVAIPLNIVVAAVVVFAVFSGKELGATTRSIRLLDGREGSRADHCKPIVPQAPRAVRFRCACWRHGSFVAPLRLAYRCQRRPCPEHVR
jgi:hypothetical protein